MAEIANDRPGCVLFMAYVLPMVLPVVAAAAMVATMMALALSSVAS